MDSYDLNSHTMAKSINKAIERFTFLDREISVHTFKDDHHVLFAVTQVLNYSICSELLNHSQRPYLELRTIA
jgi:hypothetical protein